MGVICADLQAARRPALGLPDLPITYGDYAAWQKEVLAVDGLAPEVAYWSRALGGLDFFELPADFPRRNPRKDRRRDPVATARIET